MYNISVRFVNDASYDCWMELAKANKVVVIKSCDKQEKSIQFIHFIIHPYLHNCYCDLFFKFSVQYHHISHEAIGLTFPL